MVRPILFAMLLLAAALPARPQAPERVALVVGNAAYGEAPLANPVNDARDMARKLEALGFRVLVRTDADQREMRAAVREFTAELRRAKVGLFYFAGHGLQVRGNNYLVPLRADIRGEADAEDQSIDANWILRSMEEAQVEVSIVILDACRNNPFAGTRAGSRGLAPMTAATGTLLAFSTAPGSLAADGTGRNGVYTKHLLENLDHEDLDVLRVFQRTRAGVVRETAGRQTPWESTSLMGEFRFSSRAPGTSSVPAASPAAALGSAARARATGVNSALIAEALEKVDSLYLKPPDYARMLLGALRGIEKRAPARAIKVARTNDGVMVSTAAPGREPSRVSIPAPTSLNELLEGILQGAALARQVEPTVEAAELETALLHGAVRGLDARNAFLTPTDREAQRGGSDTLSGIGLEIRRPGQVVSVVPGSPAERAGLAAGDRVVGVGGEPTAAMTHSELIQALRGPSGTFVDVEVVRDGEPSRKVAVRREIMRLPSLSSRILEPGMGYVRIGTFYNETTGHFRKALEELGKSGPLKALVLDVRHSAGGAVAPAFAIASEFVEPGSVLAQVERRTRFGGRVGMYGRTRPKYRDVPVVILVDESTAVTGEFLAAALRDAQLATVVGTRTQGKGVVTDTFALTGGAAVRIATMEFRRSTGRPLEGMGIEPDVPVPSGGEGDPQLRRAIEQARAAMH